MPSYQERSRLNKQIAEKQYRKAQQQRDKEQELDIRVGAYDGLTGRYQVLHADGGVTSNGIPIPNSAPPSDGFVRGLRSPNGNAIALGYRSYVARGVDDDIATEEALLQFIGIGQGQIFGTDDAESIPQFSITGYERLYTQSVKVRANDYEYYMVSAKPISGALHTIRFSHIENGVEIAFKELFNIPLDPRFGGAGGNTQLSLSNAAGETLKSFLMLGVADGFFVFYTFEATVVENRSGDDNFLEGFNGSSITVNYGFVDLVNNVSNTNFSTVSLAITENGDTSDVGDISMPLPSPIGSATGLFVFLVNHTPIDLQFFTSDSLLFKEGNYVFVSTNYYDFAYRLYNGASYVSAPDQSFFQINVSGVVFKCRFQLHAGIQILNNGLIVKLIGITEDNILLYATRFMTDTGWGDIQELEVLDFDITDFSFETAYIDITV